MKRIIPILIAAAVAAITVAKLRGESPLPEAPQGSWELADDEPAA